MPGKTSVPLWLRGLGVECWKLKVQWSCGTSLAVACSRSRGTYRESDDAPAEIEIVRALCKNDAKLLEQQHKAIILAPILPDSFFGP